MYLCIQFSKSNVAIPETIWKVVWLSLLTYRHEKTKSHKTNRYFSRALKCQRVLTAGWRAKSVAKGGDSRSDIILLYPNTLLITLQMSFHNLFITSGRIVVWQGHPLYYSTNAMNFISIKWNKSKLKLTFSQSLFLLVIESLTLVPFT